MRWLRLGLGLLAGIQAIQLHDALAGFVSVFFLFQAIANTGCGCAVPTSAPSDQEEIQYEEVSSTAKRDEHSRRLD